MTYRRLRRPIPTALPTPPHPPPHPHSVTDAAAAAVDLTVRGGGDVTSAGGDAFALANFILSPYAVHASLAFVRSSPYARAVVHFCGLSECVRFRRFFSSLALHPVCEARAPVRVPSSTRFPRPKCVRIKKKTIFSSRLAHGSVFDGKIKNF